MSVQIIVPTKPVVTTELFWLCAVEASRVNKLVRKVKSCLVEKSMKDVIKAIHETPHSHRLYNQLQQTGRSLSHSFPFINGYPESLLVS